MPSRRVAVIGGLLFLVVLAAFVHQFMHAHPTENAVASSAPLFQPGTPPGDLTTYLQGDFEGERLQRASWAKYQHLVDWATEPNWSSAWVIREYRVTSGRTTLTSATAEATYDTLGELDLDTFAYTPSPSRQTVPYSLTHYDPKGPWKLAIPMLQPHVGVQGAIAHLKRMEVIFPARKAVIDQSIEKIETQAKTASP